MWTKRKTADLCTGTEKFTDAARMKQFNIIKSKKVKINWLEEPKEDLQESNLTQDITSNREAFGTVVVKPKFEEEIKIITGKRLPHERKK